MTAVETEQKIVLNAGAGGGGAPVHWSFKGWRVKTLDIDPACRPDVIGSITDLSAIEDASVDGIYLSHTLEHVYPHEVPIALGQFLRVLKPDGPVVIAVPDLRRCCAAVADGRPEQPLYQSPAGPICALDMIYGHRESVRRSALSGDGKGNTPMAHKTGFTTGTMASFLLERTGFVDVRVWTEQYDLWAVGHKPKEET